MMGVTSEWVGFKQYQESLAKCAADNVSMYHRAPWLEVVVVGLGAGIRAIQTVDLNNEIVALTPVMIKRKGPFCLLGSPLSGMHTEFAGPLFAADLGANERRTVLQSQHRMMSRGGHYLEWGIKSGNEADAAWGASLESQGYRYSARPTILIELSPGESGVWASFKGRARNMIRKAEKSGVTARTVAPTETWFDEYYSMLRTTFEPQGRAVPHPLSFYQALTKLVDLGEARCVAAELDGQMIAGAIFLVDGSRMLYLSGTANTVGMKFAATSLLQWHAIREAIAEGITDYDLGGLGVPSIDKFKRSFGGREIIHHRWVRRSPFFRMAEPVAQWAARKGLIRFGNV